MQVIDNHMTESSSEKNAEEYADDQVIEILFQEGLQVRECLSEYILFGYPIEEEIAYDKSDEIEDPVSIDIKRTDGKSDHINEWWINMVYIVNTEVKINSIEKYYRIIIVYVKPK